MSSPPPAIAWMAVIGSTLALTAALAGGLGLGLWATTGAAGAFSLALAVATSRGALRSQLRGSWRDVILGLVAGCAMAAATLLLFAPAVALVPGIEGQVGLLYATLDAPPGRLAALPILIMVVVAEELIWRGVAYPLLERRFGRGRATVGATLLYMLPQLASPSWLLPLVGAGCGGLWTVQRARSGGLMIPIVTHLTWDLIVMVIAPLG